MTNKKTIRKSTILLILLVAVLIPATRSHAEKAEKGLYFSQDLGASYNPLGGLLVTKLFYRLPLLRREGILWESTKLDIGLQNEWTPADDFIGVWIAVEPIAFFDVVFKIGFYGMYDLFGYGFFGFDSSNAQYSSKELDNLNPETVPGCWIAAVPTLKLQFKSIILANSFALNRFMMRGSGYFLEIRSYTLHEIKDTDFQNDTYLMYKFSDKIIAGSVFRVQRVFETSVKTERVSVIGILKPPPKRVHGAYVVAIAGVYLRDPLMKHKPYIALKGGIAIKRN